MSCKERIAVNDKVVSSSLTGGALFSRNYYIYYKNPAIMQQIPYRPLKHILVCTNEREQGKECCSHVKGYEIFRELKDWVKSSGLASSIWVTRTGCLGFCNSVGATIVIYPDQLWFKEVKKEELQEIKDFVMGSIK